MKHYSPTEFAYPVQRICGKISRHSKVIHACTASGKQITYLQGERNLLAHPVTQAELRRQELFSRRAKAVGLRRDHQSSTYLDDMDAYRAQYDTGYKSFESYLWSLIKAEITE